LGADVSGDAAAPNTVQAVVLAAAGFEMNFGRFLLAIFAGRFVRFLIEALLTIWFGPQIVTATEVFCTPLSVDWRSLYRAAGRMADLAEDEAPTRRAALPPEETRLAG